MRAGCFVLLALGACARAGVPLAKPNFTTATSRGETPARYVAVHVDHLQPGTLRAFTEARRSWLDVLEQQHATDGRGFFVQTGDRGFLSLRPVATLGELDRQTSLGRAALAGFDARALQKYDQASDACLVPPHRNEVWRYDEALSLGVMDPTLAITTAAWGKMTVEEIDPSPAGGAYADAWSAVRAALLDAGYPLVRVSYWSQYGSGNLISFWLARSQREFLETGSVEATVTSKLGEAATDALFARTRKAVLASESVDVIPRLDLSTRLF